MIRITGVCLFLLVFFIISIPLYLIELIIGCFNKDLKAKSSQAIVVKAFKCVLAISGTKVIASGLENVPEDTPVLYVGNHRSYYDIVTCYTLVKNNTGFIAKKEMNKFLFVNVWMKFINCQFLDRDNIREGLKIILHCIDLLKTGTSIFVFPEGTRGLGKEMEPFKEGSMKMSLKSGCPVVPVAIYNTENIFETHLPFIEKQTVYVQFGEPIYPSDLSAEEKKHFGAKTQEIIREMLENIQN